MTSTRLGIITCRSSSSSARAMLPPSLKTGMTKSTTWGTVLPVIRSASRPGTFSRRAARGAPHTAPTPSSDAPQLDLLADPGDDLVQRVGERGRRLEAEQSSHLLGGGDPLLDVVS